MANTVQSLKPFGRYWTAVVTMDSTATIAVIPAGRLLEIGEINSSLLSGLGTAPSANINVQGANGDEVTRIANFTGGTTSIAFSKPVKIDGLSVQRITHTGTTVISTCSITFRNMGGAAITEV